MPKKLLFAGLGLTLALLLAAASHSIYSTVQRHAFEDSLAERISQQMTGDTGTLNFKAATDFEWDRLFVFDCYTSKQQIERTISTKWTGSMEIESSKGINLLVFMKDGKVVKYAEMSRRIDFVLPGMSGGWAADQAIFEMSKDGSRIVAKPRSETFREIQHNDESGRLVALQAVDSLGKTVKWVWFYPNGRPKVETSFDGEIRHGIERGYAEDGTLKYEGKWLSDKPWNGWCYIPERGDAGSWGGLRHWKQFQDGTVFQKPRRDPKPGPDGNKQ